MVKVILAEVVEDVDFNGTRAVGVERVVADGEDRGVDVCGGGCWCGVRGVGGRVGR